ncbi:potassium channel family protein [Halalkalibacter okhensis]|uniref:Potassium channel protein n=1 Tax=Halalkalibacter okhensis TaxID=333138 RepID=A0A0B0IJK2_9BACI|nr:potassium channel family protein [Halalkalibacter okhensis]KHF41067.1 potassium channel protein [Halalkalibacter okhensis]
MQQWLYIRTLLGHVPLVLKLLFAVISSGVVAGAIVHMLEPERFTTWFDGIWWAFITVSTVGYGDFVPESTMARVVAIVLIFVGVGFMTLLVTSFAGAAVSINQSTKEGTIAFIGEDHLVIVGWNERSRQSIENIQKKQPYLKIVLIDETLPQLPKSPKNIHFVKGNSSEDAILKQANISLARSVLITAKHSGSEFTADARTILTILAIKGLNPHISITAEILTKEQLANAERAGADQCVESTTLTGAVLSSNLLQHEASEIVNQFLEYSQNDLISLLPIKEDLIGQPFIDVLTNYYKKEMQIIGLKRSGQIFFHPHATLSLEKKDELIMIKFNKAT